MIVSPNAPAIEGTPAIEDRAQRGRGPCLEFYGQGPPAPAGSPVGGWALGGQCSAERRTFCIMGQRVNGNSGLSH